MVMFQEVILAVPYTELCWEVEEPQFDVGNDIFPWLCIRRLLYPPLTVFVVGILFSRCPCVCACVHPSVRNVLFL